MRSRLPGLAQFSAQCLPALGGSGVGVANGQAATPHGRTGTGQLGGRDSMHAHQHGNEGTGRFKLLSPSPHTR
jgi:hypothetical protein